jgi:anti-sigma-K factor RskA
MSGTRWPVSPAAVVLDAVAPADEALATRLLATDPAFRAEVERLRATTATLGELPGEAWAPEPPPPLHAEATAGRRDDDAVAVDGADAGVPQLARGATWRRGRRAVLGAAAAAAVAVVALAVVLVARGGGGDGVPAPPSTTLALRPLPGASGRAEVILNGAGTKAELRAAGLRPNRGDDYYEAWLADDRGHMVSMGTFHVGPSGRVDVHMEVAVDVSRYALVDVSREPDDGNPAHSDTSVLRGRL